MNELEIATRIGIAALAGLAVGFEREWSGHASGPKARFAGIRTFALLGSVGGIAGWLSGTEAWGAGVALLVATGGLIVAAYLAATRRDPDDLDGTTEVSALAVLGVGLLAGRGLLALAGGAAAAIVFALGEKDRFRRFIASVDEAEKRAALHFAVLALVVLPLLPEGPYGPFGAIRPRMIWTVVVLLSGINFAGYLARRTWGHAQGSLVTGALGGLVSSTAVALAFARRSREEPGHEVALAAGTVAASTVLLPRIVAITAVLNPSFMPEAARWLAPMFVGAIAVLLVVAWRSAEGGTTEPPTDSTNPLQLGTALKMALGFQAVLIALEYARDRFGEIGVLGGAAVAGLTDMDALTMSMSRLAGGGEPMNIAAAALLIGVLANTVLKAGMATALGGRRYRRWVGLSFLAMGAIGTASWLVMRRAGGS